jgi:hypothetical protein
VRELCLFIRGTGLLNLCWMECLGLHNKPKAEVHPGHLLTGPKEEVYSLKRQVVWNSRRCWEGSDKTGFVGVKLESVDWVHLAQSRSR